MPRRDDYDDEYDRPRSRRRPPPIRRRGLTSIHWFIIGLCFVGLLVVPLALVVGYLLRTNREVPITPEIAPAIAGVAELPRMAEVELPAGVSVQLPAVLPLPVEIPADPFEERKKIFLTEYPRVANRGPAWNIEADRLDLAKPYAQLAPDAEFSPSELAGKGTDGTIFPTSPSPFFATHKGKEIFDLRTGNQVATIPKFDPGFPMVDDVRLSPDGKAVAVWKLDHYLVYSTAGGEPKKFPTKFREWFDFGRDSETLVAQISDGGRHVIKINTRTGEETFLLRDQPGQMMEPTYAFSPNRKILSVVKGNNITFLGIATGNLLGSRVGPTLSFNKQPACTKMAFSADGSRWVGVFGSLKFTSVILDVATGALVSQFPLPAEVGFLVSAKHGLQMTPDGRGVLIQGQFLFDANSGALVRNLGVERKFSKTLHNTHAVITADWTIATRREERGKYDLLTAAFDRERFSEELAALGNVADELPNRAFDRTNIKLVTAPAKPDWRVPPRMSMARWERTLIPEGGPVHSFAINGPAKLAAILRSSAAGEDVGSRELKIEILRNSVGNQAPFIATKLRRPPDTIGYQPQFDCSGKFAALIDPGNTNRVIVCPLDGTPSFAFQPGDDWPVEWLGFADEQTLLSVVGNGRLTAWNIPQARAIWEIKTASKSAALSRDRRLVATYSGTRFEIMNALTGDSVGAIGVSDLPTVGFRQGTASAAFRADGKALVAAFPSGASRAIGEWDLETGKPLREPSALSQQAGGRVHAHGRRYCLVGNELFDFEKSVSLCHFVLTPEAQPAIAGLATDERLWLISPGSNRVKAVTLPNGEASNIAKALDAGTLLPVLPRGEAVSLDIRVVDCTTGRPQDVQQSLTNRLTEILKARGHAVNPGARYQVMLTAKESATGEQLELKKIREFFDSPGGTVSLRKIDLHLQVTGPQVSHQAQSSVKNKIQIGRKFPPGADVDLTLKHELWANAGDWAAVAVDVRNLYRTAEGLPVSLPLLVQSLE